MSDKQKALLSVIIGSLFGGAIAAVTKIGLLEIPPLSFAFIRFFIASILIFPFILRNKNSIFKDLGMVAALSLLASINIILFVLGIKTTTATVGQLLYAGTPFVSVLFAYYFLRERKTFQKILGMIVGFLGVSIVIFLPVFEKGKAFSGDLIGNILIGFGVVFYALYTVLSKKAQNTHSPFAITSIFILVTTVVLLPFFLFELKTQYGWWTMVSLKSLLSISYIIIFATIGTYLLHQYAIKHGGAVFATMTLYLTPVFAFLAAFALLGEKLTFGIILGGTLALLGIFLTTK